MIELGQIVAIAFVTQVMYKELFDEPRVGVVVAQILGPKHDLVLVSGDLVVIK
jgi:hypothetical protein